MNRIVGLMMVGLLAATLNLAQAASTPDATVSLSADSVAAGIGISWGSGSLTYKGKTYPISGVELVTTTQGLKFALGANGVNMKIKQ